LHYAKLTCNVEVRNVARAGPVDVIDSSGTRWFISDIEVGCTTIDDVDHVCRHFRYLTPSE